jgi:hypothetical protein
LTIRASSIWITWSIGFSSIIGSSFILEEATTVATTEWAAIQAAKTLQVVWTAGPSLVSDSPQADLQAALTTAGNIYGKHPAWAARLVILAGANG